MQVTIEVAMSNVSRMVRAMMAANADNVWYTGYKMTNDIAVYTTSGGFTYTLDTNTGILIFNGARNSFNDGCAAFIVTKNSGIYLYYDLTDNEVLFLGNEGIKIPYKLIRCESSTGLITDLWQRGQEILEEMLKNERDIERDFENSSKPGWLSYHKPNPWSAKGWVNRNTESILY